MKAIKLILAALVVASAFAVTSCGSSSKFDPAVVEELGKKNPTELTESDFNTLIDQMQAAVDQVKAAKVDDMDTQQQQEWLKQNEKLVGSVIAVPIIFYSAEAAGNNPPESVKEKLNKLLEENKSQK